MISRFSDKKQRTKLKEVIKLLAELHIYVFVIISILPLSDVSKKIPTSKYFNNPLMISLGLLKFSQVR